MTAPSSHPAAPVVVAALGSQYRRDDGAGPAVAASVAGLLDGVRVVAPLGDPLDLLGAWDGAGLAVVIDAVRTGSRPGTISVLELTPNGTGATSDPQRAGGSADRHATSSHGIGLAGVLRLARAVGRAPDRVVVVGIEGGEFGQGAGLSAEVAAAIPRAAHEVAILIEEVRRCA